MEYPLKRIAGKFAGFGQYIYIYIYIYVCVCVCVCVCVVVYIFWVHQVIGYKNKR